MIKYEKQGDIGLFTIENGKVNPMNPEMHREFNILFKAFLADPEVKVGILTGAGDRAFCAGDDIKSIRPDMDMQAMVERHLSPSPEDGPHLYPGWERENHMMTRHKPMISAVKGWCLGQGMFYLLRMTDLRVAGESAKFGLPEIAYDMAGASGVAYLPKHLPRVEAMKLVLTGDPIDAAEALRIGLINEVVPDEEVLDRAFALAKRIARHPARALRVEMEIFQHAENTDERTCYVMADHIYRLQRLASPTKAWEVDFQKKGVKG